MYLHIVDSGNKFKNFEVAGDNFLLSTLVWIVHGSDIFSSLRLQNLLILKNFWQKQTLTKYFWTWGRGESKRRLKVPLDSRLTHYLR